MKTSDSVEGKCPRCGGRVSDDPSGKGWVRHLEHLNGCDDGDVYGTGERDD